MTKAPYEAPVLRAHGKVEAVTKGTSNGINLDAAFPIGTPLPDLTVS